MGISGPSVLTVKAAELKLGTGYKFETLASLPKTWDGMTGSNFNLSRWPSLARGQIVIDHQSNADIPAHFRGPRHTNPRLTHDTGLWQNLSCTCFLCLLRSRLCANFRISALEATRNCILWQKLGFGRPPSGVRCFPAAIGCSSEHVQYRT